MALSSSSLSLALMTVVGTALHHAARVSARVAERPPASLHVSPLVSDGMVLQRRARVPIWGSAAPGTTVVVALDQRNRSTTANASGVWEVFLPPMMAGGPHTIRIRAGTEQIDVNDVLVGDVWVASGQSNMEFTVANASDGAQQIATARDTRIRQFKVPNSFSSEPSSELAGGEWARADREHVSNFSAVAYFFAQELRRTSDVPIGIINTSWGGSRIEAWMSASALRLSGAQWKLAWERELARQRTALDSLRARIGELPTVDAGLVDGRALWADPALDESRWVSIAVPSLWEDAGYADMDGIGWYRTTFALTAEEIAKGVRLGLGTIDDSDISWVNGIQVGQTEGAYNRPRIYDVAPSALRLGRNVLAVRVEDTGGGGGIYGDPSLLYLEIGGVRRPLRDGWKFRVGVVTVKPDGQRINKVPTVLYNKMVQPLLPFPIKGVIWYQGESNADRLEDAAAYRALFADMITSWRGAWGVGDFPFLWVQLPNFMAPVAQPSPTSNWATLREAQTAALRLPRTGQAVVIDLGEAGDIHPKNKHDVGVRLAAIARAVAYGQAVANSGPAFRRFAIRGKRVTIEFQHAKGLRTRAAGETVGGFAISGSDRHFVWAKAEIVGDKIVAWSDQVARPVAVRYAWEDNPDHANLVNAAGLPAAPFRTDAW
jgi:sialate O-acetylesterase